MSASPYGFTADHLDRDPVSALADTIAAYATRPLDVSRHDDTVTASGDVTIALTVGWNPDGERVWALDDAARGPLAGPADMDAAVDAAFAALGVRPVRDKTMTAAEVLLARMDSGMTAGDYAAALGVAARTLGRWERGEAPAPGHLAGRTRRVELDIDTLAVEMARAYREGGSVPMALDDQRWSGVLRVPAAWRAHARYGVRWAR